MLDLILEFYNPPKDIAIEYIRVIWLTVFIITILLACICYLYLAIRRAEERERKSLDFSHLAIDELEAERRRISRELHDTVLPLVKETGLRDHIRSICMELMPPDFSRLFLRDTLANLCEQSGKNSGIEYACFIDEDIDFSLLKTESQLHLFRMVQESFINVEKHSKADRVVLVIQRGTSARSDLGGGFRHSSPGQLLICVSDDGVGLAGDWQKKAGIGIRGMRQRAAILGAKLDFISESGAGLMVRIEIPESSCAG
ncbi:MAG: histidine kinase [Treponema sp.]|jgi:two-component system NarL family sensor kinase|nr:histidine kinase [Treponema sp.]